MKRCFYQDLLRWKSSGQRKPLIVKGARQVGKTYLLTRFGQKEFKNYHHFDFTKNRKLASVFDDGLDALEIIKRLEIQYEQKINVAEDLIIFDEIKSVNNMTMIQFLIK